MKTLRVTQLKPNPAGKDRMPDGRATPAQLGGEWVDFRNNGQYAVDMAGVGLYNLAYDRAGNPSWALVTKFKGSLGAGETVRVHSGRIRDVSVLYQEDVRGADHHVFSGEDRYVWNNDKADTARLSDNDGKIDVAGYDPYPPEGVILVRVGDKLLAAAGVRR